MSEQLQVSTTTQDGWTVPLTPGVVEATSIANEIDRLIKSVQDPRGLLFWLSGWFQGQTIFAGTGRIGAEEFMKALQAANSPTNCYYKR